MRRVFIYLVFLLGISKALSQNDIPRYQHDDMIWVGYYNYFELNEKWNINSDFQFRTKEWYQKNSQVLGRVGIVYRLNEKVNFTLGLAHFRFFLADDVTRGEWRPWQEVGLSDKIGKLKITNRIRVEQRFTQKVSNNVPINEYGFNWRFRHKFDVQFPICKSHERTVYMAVGNEIMINAGPAVNTYFDQNRTYGGINYEHNKNLTLQFQFMYIWQQLSNGYTLDKISVIRFNIQHTIRNERAANK